MSKKIVFLKGSNCAPCKQFEPVFDKLTAEFNLPVEKRTDDVDSLRKFGLRTVPAVVLFTQASYSHAINKVSEDIKTTSNSSKKDPKVYAINETVKHNGINYKVNSVDFKEGTGFSKTENGEKYVVANITMTNNGKSDFDYNPVDFKLSIDGNEPNEITVAPDGVDTFNSGTLKPGATMTGNLVLGKLNVDNVKELLMVHHDNNSIKSADYTFSVKLK